MKKFLKGFLLFFCLPIAIAVAFVFGSILYVRNVDHFSKSCMTEHLAFLYNDSEEGAIDNIKNKLESEYMRVLKDLKQEKEMEREVYTIMIHPDVNSFQSKMMGLPWWLADMLKAAGANVTGRERQYVGATDNFGLIRVVSPLNLGESGYTYDQMLDVAVHELTHKVVDKMGNQLVGTGFGFMLFEGVASYEANQGYMYEKDKSFNSQVLSMLPKSIDDLTVDNDDIQAMGYSFVKYVVENYGYDKLVDLLKKEYYDNGYDFETRAIYNEWIEYLEMHRN